MNRRHFLKGSLTLLGLGALGGCRKYTPAQNSGPQGRRNDPNFLDGHRLRRGDYPDRVARTEQRRGVILGGGIAGLSAAWRWSGAGFDDYLLLELEGETGGNSRSASYAATDAPLAAHYLPVPNREARAVRLLLRHMGVLEGPQGEEALATPEVLCHSLQERLFYKGRWREGLVPYEELSFAAQREVADFFEDVEAWRARRDRLGRKVFALPSQLSSQEPEFLALDRISFADYVARKGWRAPELLWYLEYGCRDDYGLCLSNCSAWAGLHHFASRDGGGIATQGQVLVWPEGNRRLVEALLERVSGEVKTGALVLSVKPDREGVTVDYLDLESQERVRVHAEVALFCLPAFVRSRLLEDEAPSSLEYRPWVTANLVLDRVPEDLGSPGDIAWDNVIASSESLGYVVATHQHLHQSLLEPTVWTWYRPFPSGDPKQLRERLLEMSWEDWAQQVFDDLEPLHADLRQRCQRLDVTVLGHGMVAPTLGTVWGEGLREARKSRGRLHFGHGDLAGMSMFEESQYWGVRSAEKALEQLAVASQTWL